jgi:hypothetical protein
MGSPMKKVLNMGVGTKKIALPTEYAGFEQLLLDLDSSCEPDIVLEAAA